MKVVMQTVPYTTMRYKTAGDWQFIHPGQLLVTAAELGCWKMESCLQFHELAEALVCKFQGITQETVDAFDFSYAGDGEPGDDPFCPYRIAHRVASAVEYILALALDVDWAEYEERIQAL